MRREQPDRVPIHVRGVPAWNEEWIASRDRSYRPLIRAVAACCDMVAGWRFDSGLFLSSMGEIPIDDEIQNAGDWSFHKKTVHAPGGPLTFITQVSHFDYPSLTKKFWIENDEDLRRFLSIPYVPPKPDVGSFFRFDKKIGDRAIVMVGFLDPIGYVHDLLGSERLAIWSVERREVIAYLVDLFTMRLYNLIHYLIDNGVKGVYGLIGEEYAGPPLMSPQDFHEFVTEPERRLVNLIHTHGCLVHIHCHGPMQMVIEEFVKIGADCLHPIEDPPLGDMPLAEAKKRIGKEVCLEGNIQIGDIYACQPWEIKNKVKRAIDEAAEGGGFILCPTASPYTKKLPSKVVKNYLTMIETGLEYGKY